jgi:hypothetical protein
MNSKQITVAQCAALSGLEANEMVLGVSPTAAHASLHASYLLHNGRGWEAVRDMIVADIRASLDLGALKQAADLLIVLRRFLLERIKVAVVHCLQTPAKIISFPSSLRVLHGDKSEFDRVNSRNIKGIHGARRSNVTPQG